jgi:hypothetical protein
MAGQPRASARAESVARPGKTWIKNRTHHLVQSLLGQSIHHRGNAKPSHSLPVRLRYFYPPDRTRFVAPCQQPLSDPRPLLLQICPKIGNGHSINSRGFLRIPPRDGHPCRPANSSPDRACRGLSPPRCAPCRAHKKKGPRFGALKIVNSRNAH